MAQITSPILLDSTGQQIKTAIQGLAPTSIDNITGAGTAARADVETNPGLVTSGALPTSAQVVTYVAQQMASIPAPMVFKGTLGTGGTISQLPTASSVYEGYVYRVITEGTYDGQAAKAGDMFICSGSGSVYGWTLIPSGDDGGGDATYATCELAAGSWLEATNGVYQQASITGVKASSTPTLDVLITTDDFANIDALNEAWSQVYSAETIADGIIFYAKSIPATTMTIQVKGY